LPRGHAAIAFVDVGVGFADRAAVLVAVGFLRICITPETMSAFGPSFSSSVVLFSFLLLVYKHYNIKQKDEEI